jgi:AraC-like DNA-binding protein
MKNFYKYLPVSTEDRDWGMQLLHAGCHKYYPGKEYPVKGHPSNYYFSLENGRVLQEFSLIYITEGRGVFNSHRTGDIPVEGGSVIIVFPNERHRYHPDFNTGWEEYWFGFNGPIIQNLINKRFFSPLRPVIHIGYNETTLNLYMQIIEAIREERPGYQPLICGAAMYILGQLHTSEKQRLFTIGDEEKIVNHARLIIRSTLENDISPQEIAGQLQISYSRFRKLFKEYTGLAPVQYLIQLKLEKAKEELISGHKSVKEISYELNFESSHYFSRLFKEKTGLTPLAFRKGFGGIAG